MLTTLQELAVSLKVLAMVLKVLQTCHLLFSFHSLIAPPHVPWKSSLTKPSTHCFMPFENPSYWMALLLDIHHNTTFHQVSDQMQSYQKDFNLFFTEHPSYSPLLSFNFSLAHYQLIWIYLFCRIINLMLLAWHLQESADLHLAHCCISSAENSVWNIVDTQWIFEIATHSTNIY